MKFIILCEKSVFDVRFYALKEDDVAAEIFFSGKQNPRVIFHAIEFRC